ncbi:endonuclease domain-containing protein [Methyloligella sp. 2.7D]|uniref:endonuclease domain-containing protein n=1 Tax=unclassified Methyloligella TaxID=2625955 RepID=UPI00157DA957|nr:endonuclease domain-containing protein [Methyloligella sp. GL2]QKP78018.1 endonuclease domain-containing protein [Methyloligella sp. GL2]
MKTKLTPVAKKLRKEMGKAETKLWFELRDRRFRGVKFRRQVPIGSYVADFASKKLGLIIEVDGGQHAELTMEKDAQRTAYLEQQGFRVIRFWNNDVLKNIEGVMHTIGEAIDHAPSPGATRHPLPGGERALPPQVQIGKASKHDQ